MASFLEVVNISKSYGVRTLFKNVSFNINEGDKIALVAPNGAGKTSMLRIIAGRESSDGQGEIRFMKNISVAFLDQESDFDPDDTIFEAVSKKIEVKEAQVEDFRIKEILSKLRLNDVQKKISSLSGGEKKRVAIAVLLVNNPDFLVMDEPTNHLDIESIEFLEEYLRRSRSTLLMVTHDRYFLDRVCNIIIELDMESVFRYEGNYSYFLEKRDERVDNFNSATQRARNLLRGELDWIRRTPCARGTKARYRVEAFDRLQERASQTIVEQSVKIVAGMQRLGKKVVDCSHLSYREDGFCALNDFSYKFTPGEKVGIIGPNGVGKSTFLDLITGSLSPTSGQIDIGTTVCFGYYRQSGIGFRSGQTVLEYIREIADHIQLGDGKRVSATTFLNYFLFPPSMHNSLIEKLSGGEKRRLYLLSILVSSPNFLILDEPTNDLDIVTLNVLEEYLRSYSGTLLIVSHDRFFMDKIVDHLFVFNGEGKIKDFPGNYSSYRESIYANPDKVRAAKPDAQTKNSASGKPRMNVASSADGKKKLSWKQQKELERIEAELPKLEAEKQSIEQSLSSGTLSSQELLDASRKIGEIIELIDQYEMMWLELSE